MSGVGGIYSPKYPDLYSSNDFEALAEVLGRPGVSRRTFFATGLALALFHTPAFLAPGEAADPHWLEDERGVVALAGGLRADLGNATQRQQPGWQADVIRQHYLAGDDVFPRDLDGLFTVLVWDAERSRLTLATDVVGTHQLYFFHEPATGYTAFASELKALLKLSRVPSALDQEAVAVYLRLGCVHPPLTIIEGVSKALPFEKICVDELGNLTRARYYSLPAMLEPERSNDLGYWQGRIREEVIESVARVTRGTRDVALLLSGGIDSTVMLSAMHEAGVPNIITLTLTWDHAGPDELALAAESAQIAGADHHLIQADSRSIDLPLISALFREYDEPTDTFSRAMTQHLLVTEANRLGIPSTLNGNHGETTICDFAWMRYVNKLGAGREGSRDVVERYYTDLPTIFSDERQTELTHQKVNGTAVIQRIIRGFKVGTEAGSDFETFINVDGLCDRTGRLSIPGQVIPRFHGVEQRSGFADRGIIEFGKTVPTSLRGAGRDDKYPRTLLKAAFAECMPTLARKSFNSAMPGFPWQDHQLLKSIVVRQAKRSGETGLLDPAAVQKTIVMYETRASKRDFLRVWALFVLQTWVDFHIEGVDPFDV